MNEDSFLIQILNDISETEKDRLYELSIAYFNEYAGHDETSKIAFLNKEHIDNYFSAFINRQDRQTSIARVNNDIVGYITYYEKPRQCFYEIASIGEVSGLYVSEEYRNKGIGKKLIENAIKFFRSRRIQYYSLLISVNDTKGIEYFKKNGMYTNNVIMHGEI
jgi:ribosomal protein S18 acetylase RimI-like enzyme